MAKPKVVVKRVYRPMTKVRCPATGGTIVWANPTKGMLIRCTHCGGTGHDRA